MDDLVVWLRQQLDEDERVANEVAALRRSWSVDGGYEETGPTRVVGEAGYVIVEDDTDWASEIVQHIARHDPARVLREVEAKKRRLDEFAKARAWLFAEEDPTVQITVAAMCATWDKAIRIDATVYAERPGYREQWKP